jgi:2-haloacid dehalogenase
MPREISALVFDAYGTLFDVHSVGRLAESLFPGKGAALSAAWRTKQLEYSWLRSLMRRYEDFSRVTSASLAWAMESLGIDPSENDAACRALIDEYRKLAMFPEVPAALESLAARMPLAILSNGHPEMLEAVVDHNRVRERFRGGVLSVHKARVFKPAPDVYAIAEETLGVPRSLLGFVSSNGWDAAGAKTFGFRVFWINRSGAPVERLGVRPDAVIKSLAEVEPLLA